MQQQHRSNRIPGALLVATAAWAHCPPAAAADPLLCLQDARGCDDRNDPLIYPDRDAERRTVPARLRTLNELLEDGPITQAEDNELRPKILAEL